jgi:hypothetical protein
VKVFSVVVLDSLAEALRCIYWYKPDLRSFLLRSGLPSDLLGRLDWTQHKREIVRELLDSLTRRSDRGAPLISKVIDAVVEQDDFAHLARLEDGQRKAKDATDAVSRLKELLGHESVAERAERARAEKRTEAERRKTQIAARQAAMQSMFDEFNVLRAMDDERARGIAFEDFLRRLFALHDLDPRGAFAIPGEQTDGSIRLDSHFFLVEARWRVDATSPADIRAFRGKVEEKLDNTLGIFVAMNGFTPEAIKRAATPPAKVILIDGLDLAPVLQGLTDFVEMLRRKVRAAAEAGDVHFRVQ